LQGDGESRRPRRSSHRLERRLGARRRLRTGVWVWDGAAGGSDHAEPIAARGELGLCCVRDPHNCRGTTHRSMEAGRVVGDDPAVAHDATSRATGRVTSVDDVGRHRPHHHFLADIGEQVVNRLLRSGSSPAVGSCTMISRDGRSAPGPMRTLPHCRRRSGALLRTSHRLTCWSSVSTVARARSTRATGT